MFSNGRPQIRQSEGKRTEKRLSAVRRANTPARPNNTRVETIECPATATLPWLVRIRSSLLLKTASCYVRVSTPVNSSIAANDTPRQRSGWTMPCSSRESDELPRRTFLALA